MKLSLALGKRRALDRRTAWACLTTNQFVLPGMGSLISGRRSGYLQALLALAGMITSAVFAGWLLLHWGQFLRQVEAEYSFAGLWAQEKRWWLVGLAGFGSFFCAWFWALASSLAILNESLPPDGPPLR